jgi:hypothetical protein
VLVQRLQDQIDLELSHVLAIVVGQRVAKLRTRRDRDAQRAADTIGEVGGSDRVTFRVRGNLLLARDLDTTTATPTSAFISAMRSSCAWWRGSGKALRISRTRSFAAETMTLADLDDDPQTR